MSNDYNINPVKAAAKAYQKGDCGIHALNSACYGVCADFQDVITPWGVSMKCQDQCEDFLEELRWQYYDSGYCGHERPDPPAIWKQVPALFPALYDKNRNIRQSLAMCKKECEKTPYPESCKEKCDLDSYAVEETKEQHTNKEGYRSRHHSSIDFKKAEKKNPILFWIGFLIAVLIMVLFIYIVGTALVGK